MVTCGSVVVVAVSGDYGKPRPAVVVQNARSAALIDSLTLCLMTSDLSNASRLRITVEPDATNGLRRVSQVQADKVQTVPKTKVGRVIGTLSPAHMEALDLALALHLSLYAPVPPEET